MGTVFDSLSTQQKEETERQLALYSLGAAEIIPIDDFKEKLAASIKRSKPLKIKLGLDPSAPDVHLGHTVVLNKLRQFQENGHVVQLIIGDFTGRIGDPTGKSSARKQLTEEEVASNAQTYFEQFGKVLDMEKTELHYNSTWLAPMSFEDVIHLAGKMTVARLLERDDFEKRITSGKPVSLHEFFYPLMQGYDSVALECDVEIGGTDQHFNILMGRHYQEKYGKEKQVALLLPLLTGLDGKEKMSKSKNNYIGINEDPHTMYGKSMSIPDESMVSYFTLATNTDATELASIQQGLSSGKLHPRDCKMMLAKKIVSMYHGAQAAEKAQQQFIDVFQKNRQPDQMPTATWNGPEQVTIIDLLCELNMFTSKSEARRMIKNGGVKVDGNKITSDDQLVSAIHGTIIGIGKRKWLKIHTH